MPHRTAPQPHEPGASQSTQAREFSTRLSLPVHSGMTAPWALAERERRNPDGTLMARKASLGRSWRQVSAKAFRAQVREVAAGLVAKGLQPGQAVGIMAHTSYEWSLMDFAAWEAGLVVVPIYETSSADQAQWILTNAAVRLVLVENEAMETMVCNLRGSVPELADLQVLCLEREAVLELTKAGKGVDAAELDRRTAALTSSTTATIVYTSTPRAPPAAPRAPSSVTAIWSSCASTSASTSRRSSRRRRCASCSSCLWPMCWGASSRSRSCARPPVCWAMSRMCGTW